MRGARPALQPCAAGVSPHPLPPPLAGRAISALALLLTACSPLAAQAPIAEQWRALEVAVALVAYPDSETGALRYRGGLDLSSDDALFGGLSGMEVLDDGRWLAISDAGQWFEARLVLDRDGALVGLSDVRTAAMRDENGEPFRSKRKGDSEGLAQLPDGRFAASFEQSHSIRLYDLNRDGPFGAAAPGPTLDGVRNLRANVGLEAIAAANNGDLLVAAEGDGDAAPLWRAPVGSQTQVAPVARYRLEPGYSLTALDRLPDGDFIALERFYAPVLGARARIARFSEQDLSTGGSIETTELARIAAPAPVDNFEAIAAIAMPDGATRVYVLSDDNFSNRQRTLLLAFDLMSTTRTAAHPPSRSN